MDGATSVVSTRHRWQAAPDRLLVLHASALGPGCEEALGCLLGGLARLWLGGGPESANRRPLGGGASGTLWRGGRRGRLPRRHRGGCCPCDAGTPWGERQDD